MRHIKIVPFSMVTALLVVSSLMVSTGSASAVTVYPNPPSYDLGALGGGAYVAPNGLDFYFNRTKGVAGRELVRRDAKGAEVVTGYYPNWGQIQTLGPKVETLSVGANRRFLVFRAGLNKDNSDAWFIQDNTTRNIMNLKMFTPWFAQVRSWKISANGKTLVAGGVDTRKSTFGTELHWYSNVDQSVGLPGPVKLIVGCPYGNDITMCLGFGKFNTWRDLGAFQISPDGTKVAIEAERGHPASALPVPGTKLCRNKIIVVIRDLTGKTAAREFFAQPKFTSAGGYPRCIGTHDVLRVPAEWKSWDLNPGFTSFIAQAESYPYFTYHGLWTGVIGGSAFGPLASVGMLGYSPRISSSGARWVIPQQAADLSNSARLIAGTSILAKPFSLFGFTGLLKGTNYYKNTLGLSITQAGNLAMSPDGRMVYSSQTVSPNDLVKHNYVRTYRIP